MLERRPRHAPLAILLLVGTAVLSSCLAPGAPDPTGHAPFGNLELNVQSGAGIRVAGWAIDPDTSDPVAVQVKVEGQDVREVRADLARPDLAAGFPGRGTAHGFDLTVPDLGPGKRQVCVWVNDVGVGGDTRVLGCKDIVISVDPFGRLESLSADADGTVRASGWVADPETTGPTPVGITLDGARVLVQPTDVVRPDIAAQFGFGDVRGFDVRFPAAAGRHTVCAVAGNVGWGEARFVGCSDVVVSAVADRRPDLRLTSVAPVGASGARIRGTVTDPDSPGGPIAVSVRVDGVRTQTTNVTGSVIDTTITGLAAGRHELCVWAVDVPGIPATLIGDRLLPCSSVVLGANGVPSIGTVGAVTSSTGVGPPSGSELAAIDRDAGVSVELRDGSTLWLFGDSSQLDDAGNMEYFVNNTAAWAPAGTPASTRDAVVGGDPVQFVSSGDGFTCPSERPTAALWPMSAVTTPSGPDDLVTAFFAEVCMGEGFLNVESHGVTVVQWTYRPSSPPDRTPIRGTVVDRDLFPSTMPYGSAAVAVQDSGAGSGDAGWFVYGYRCTSPEGDGPFWSSQYGPCTVGRVPIGSVDQRSAWRFWNGASWVVDQAAAAPVLAAGGTDPEIPVAAFTVTRDDALGVYVMAYSPWPGFIDRVYVRVSTTPVGPWSQPVSIHLPGCEDSVGPTDYWCYAGSAQPRFSTSGAGASSIGIGWYDQLVSAGPIRGQYRAASVPFAVG